MTVVWVKSRHKEKGVTKKQAKNGLRIGQFPLLAPISPRKSRYFKGLIIVHPPLDLGRVFADSFSRERMRHAEKFRLDCLLREIYT
jgi:hypothetical protein